MTQIGEGLIVKVARDAATLCFGFVGELHARICKLAVRVFERRPCARQPAILAIASPQRDERQHQQHREQGGRARKRSARDLETKS